MRPRNQKLTTPILIRILRRLVRSRAFQQRKAKLCLSRIKGPPAAAVASLERPSISSAINRGRSDFKSRQVTSMTALANTVLLCTAVLLMSDAVIAQTPQKSATQSSPQFQLACIFPGQSRTRRARYGWDQSLRIIISGKRRGEFL